MIEHKMLKAIHLKYSGRDDIRPIAEILFSLWSLVMENLQINRITRHREERGLKWLNKDSFYCNHLEAVVGNETKKKL